MSALQRVADSEIHFQVLYFFDAGWTVRLGDHINGFVAETMCDSLAAAEEALHALVLKHYPRCTYASAVDTLECPCCGDDGAYAASDGTFYDGQPLICGCPGNVTCDPENEPEITRGDEPCSIQHWTPRHDGP